MTKLDTLNRVFFEEREMLEDPEDQRDELLQAMATINMILDAGGVDGVNICAVRGLQVKFRLKPGDWLMYLSP